MPYSFKSEIGRAVDLAKTGSSAVLRSERRQNLKQALINDQGVLGSLISI